MESIHGAGFMTSEAPKSKTVIIPSIEQMRASLAKAWLAQEQERLSQVFLADLKEVMAHCEQLRADLAEQQLLEQQTLSHLTLADKLRLKLGVALTSRSMSTAAQQLALIRERIPALQLELSLNSPGSKPAPNGPSSMLARVTQQHDAAVKQLLAQGNMQRAAWVEARLQSLLIEEHKQLTEARKAGSTDTVARKALRSTIELNVSIQGERCTVSAVTRDISDTGVFVDLLNANQAFIEGELLTVQVSDLPAEATAVQGIAVRVSANGLGVNLFCSKNPLRPE
jgi:predicted RNA-binding protein YlxR (DUF448 family)